MTDPGPVWDGDGIDPWLPERLSAQQLLVEAEQSIYRALWSALSAWLVGVRRAVLRGGPGLPPDPNAVYGAGPAWAQATNRFVQGPIRDVMRVPYEAIFGPGYRFDARPAVAAHLAQVHNRMVRTPEHVYDLVAAEVAAGAGDGESIPEITERIEEVLSATDTPRWRNRAVVVARTETIGALNAGRTDAFTAVTTELGEAMEQMWLATADERTRPTHAAADGQRVPVGSPFMLGADPVTGFAGHPLAFPGDPTGPAHEVIQCRCSTLLVRPGESVDLSGRQFTDW